MLNGQRRLSPPTAACSLAACSLAACNLDAREEADTWGSWSPSDGVRSGSIRGAFGELPPECHPTQGRPRGSPSRNLLCTGAGHEETVLAGRAGPPKRPRHASPKTVLAGRAGRLGRPLHASPPTVLAGRAVPPARSRRASPQTVLAGRAGPPSRLAKPRARRSGLGGLGNRRDLAAPRRRRSQLSVLGRQSDLAMPRRRRSWLGGRSPPKSCIKHFIGPLLGPCWAPIRGVKHSCATGWAADLALWVGPPRPVTSGSSTRPLHRGR